MADWGKVIFQFGEWEVRMCSEAKTSTKIEGAENWRQK